MGSKSRLMNFIESLFIKNWMKVTSLDFWGKFLLCWKRGKMGHSALLNFFLNQFIIFLKLYLMSSIKKSFKLTVLKNSYVQTGKWCTFGSKNNSLELLSKSNQRDCLIFLKKGEMGQFWVQNQHFQLFFKSI